MTFSWTDPFTNRLDEKFDASPAAVCKDLFLRGHDYLYCITEK